MELYTIKDLTEERGCILMPEVELIRINQWQ